MHKVNGIVVHQTAAPTASSTFSSYQVNGANGAHFLIDRDGTIYQTASLRKRTNHVGNIKSRCLETRKCSPAEFNAAYPLKWRPTPLSRHEHRKPFPERYPGNTDSVGIELVGAYIEKNEVYESVTPSQNDAVRWLVAELSATTESGHGRCLQTPSTLSENRVRSELRKMVRNLLLALCAMLWLVMSPVAHARAVKAVTIDAVGLSRLEEMAQECKKFRPSVKLVKRYFSRAYPVDAIYYSKKFWSPCWASGTIEYADGNRGKWRLSSGGAAYLEWSHSGEVILYFKNNGWQDPFGSGYDESV
jgi:hypothetical protein